MAGWSITLPLLKRVLPLRTLVQLTWVGGTRGRASAREQQIVRLSALLPRFRFPHFRANCLERSLLAYRFLAEANANPTLVIAVRRAEAEVVGHAWVAVDGRPVHESEAAVRDFVPLVEFGSRGFPADDRAVTGTLPDHWE